MTSFKKPFVKWGGIAFVFSVAATFCYVQWGGWVLWPSWDDASVAGKTIFWPGFLIGEPIGNRMDDLGWGIWTGTAAMGVFYGGVFGGIGVIVNKPRK